MQQYIRIVFGHSNHNKNEGQSFHSKLKIRISYSFSHRCIYYYHKVYRCKAKTETGLRVYYKTDDDLVTQVDIPNPSGLIWPGSEITSISDLASTCEENFTSFAIYDVTDLKWVPIFLK